MTTEFCPAQKLPDDYLLDLLAALEEAAYEFVAPTPETHRRVIEHYASREDRGLREIFGWSLSFARESIPDPLFQILLNARILSEGEGRYRSKLRVATVAGRLFLHSAYPTDKPDSVFLGPDTYRFARMIGAELNRSAAVRRVIDVGAGAGVGAIVAREYCPQARLTLTDVNPLALRLASINARHATAAVELVEGSGLDGVRGTFDLVIANPPFIADPDGPAYRSGGGPLGSELSLAWAGSATRRLDPGGRLLLYTASPVIAGRDALRGALATIAERHECSLRYEEVDPDIFGEELDEPTYRDVERIAAIVAVFEKSISCSSVGVS